MGVGRPDALAWAIKLSFRVHISGVGATIICSSGARDFDGEFRFPVREVIVHEEETRIECDGRVIITAHGGLLEVVIEDPVLSCNDERVVLSITHPTRGRGFPVAEGDPIAAGAEQTGQLRLLEPATVLFDFSYPAGTDLEPVHLVHSP